MESSQQIIDFISANMPAFGTTVRDSSSVALDKALENFRACTTATLSDSVAVNYLASWYCFFLSQDERAMPFCSLACELAMRDSSLYDSIRSEMQTLKSFLQAGAPTGVAASGYCEELLKNASSQPPASLQTAVDFCRELANREFARDNVQVPYDLGGLLCGLVDSLSAEQLQSILETVTDFCRIQGYRGDYVMAESLLTKCLYKDEKAHGPSHASTAMILGCLADLYSRSGRPSESFELSRRAIAIYESLPPKRSAEIPAAYHILGYSYLFYGLYEQAEACFEQEAKSDSVIIGPQTVLMCRPLVGLASVRSEQCRHEEAESLLKQAIARFDQGNGWDTIMVGDIYWRLGVLYIETAQPDKAEEMFHRGLEAYGRYRGMIGDMTRSAQSLFACAATLQKEFDVAIRRTLESMKEFVGKQSPDFYDLKSSLQVGAEVFRVAGQYDSSLEYYDRLLALKRSYLQRSFPFLTESQRLQWLNALPPIEHGLLSLARHLQQSKYLGAAYEMTINAKSTIVDAALAERRIVLCSGEEHAEPALNEYLRVSTLLANLYYSQMTQSSGPAQSGLLLSLEGKRDSLELSLSRVCFAYGGPLRQHPVSPAEVVDRLDREAVLWDFIRYFPSDSATARFYGHCSVDEHYAVFVVDHTGVTSLHDIGRVAEIDSLVRALRSAVGAGVEELYTPQAPHHEARVRGIANEITRRMPVLRTRDSSSPGTIYISPDGLLGLLPFELLTRDSNRYLIDEYRISYLSSSRDLVNEAPVSAANRRAVILAAPDFERAAGIPEQSARKIDASANSRTEFAEGLAACFGNGFVPLSQSAKEADAVTALLSSSGISVTARRGREATESFVRSLTTEPGILHFATHGFFCDNSDSTELKVLRSPLLRSGLALAGANRTLRGKSGSTSDDGILTAYEVSAMNLANTDLVVMSACETGAGDVTRSEGVLGLARAFRRAGAKSVIMNLWRASDKSANELVTGYYREWLGGKSKVDALREAMRQAKARAKQRFGHTDPYLWCGFVLVGDSR